ncbi:hypothetical protein N7462_002422 [Penicillium macrosclerotiorum]|uniref:uncharacterized protein n=1 Tax=Penicillium macrosclerotiorum TaxID=303699 RepID=UPI00254989D7|nr:uncharacterized protein N7462_002422 [Penicillium macrosclerotiorum]KAJ5692999.1 hypothetical protein N7462_002422 [Penicillium macrosclerotiorum]
MSVQTVQQNVPKQTARGHFPSHRVNYSDSPISIQASKVDLPLRKGDVSIQPGDGAAYPRRRDDRADTDTQSSTDDQDVMIQHKALVTHFNNFPDHMENPYARLEQDKWVLEVDDDDQTIFHRMAKQIKDLEKKRENVRKEQWIRGIYKIIPWVIGKNPNLLDHTGGNPNQGDQAGEPNALEFAAKRCVPIAYCMLNLLLDQTTQEILRQQCDGTACRVNLKHPLIAYAKETRLEGSECPHGKADEILEFHDQLKLKLQRASQQTQSSKSSLHYIIARYCEAPDCNAVKELVRLSGADVIVPPRGNSSQRLLHLAVEKFQRPKEQDHEALNSLKDIIKTIVEVCPQALYEKDDKHKTAYEALLLHKANQEPTGKGIAGELQRRVLEVLKEAYIGDNMVDHNVKINSLYPGGVEGNVPLCLPRVVLFFLCKGRAS